VPDVGANMNTGLRYGSAVNLPSDIGTDYSTENRDILELDFTTESRLLTAGISCPAGVRILDLLNTPYAKSGINNSEFMELEDRSNPHMQPRNMFIKKESILFVSAPDKELRRGLGSDGVTKVYPFISKTPVKIGIQIKNYLLIGNIFKTDRQSVKDVLNNDMFFLPLTDARIMLNSVFLGDRPFLAVNKQQISSVIIEY
jgi:hypothetical protein